MSNLLGFVPLFIAFFAAAPAIMWWPEVFTSKNSLSERYTALMMACCTSLICLFAAVVALFMFIGLIKL